MYCYHWGQVEEKKKKAEACIFEKLRRSRSRIAQPDENEKRRHCVVLDLEEQVWVEEQEMCSL